MKIRFMRHLLFVLLITVLSLGAAAVAGAQDGTLEPCTNLATRAFSTNVIVDGGYCTLIVENGEYLPGRSSGEIGVESVLRQNILYAVDIFDLDANGIPTQNFTGVVPVCFRGQGDVIVLDGNVSPRSERIPYFTYDGDYTCTAVENIATVVLVEGDGVSPIASGGQQPPVELTPDPETGEIPEQPVGVTTGSVTGAVALEFCRVKTNNAPLRLRTFPSTVEGESEIIDTLPFGLTLQATERTDEWYRVVYLDGQGWVSARFMDVVAGNCGEVEGEEG